MILQRVVTSLQTLPAGYEGWKQVALITCTTTFTAGALASFTGFIDPINDFDPPPTSSPIKCFLKPASAFIFPSLFEELIWRAALIPLSPSSTTASAIGVASGTSVTHRALTVLVIHVLSHPIAGATIWPRGSNVFNDLRFLLLATVVLGGATASYIGSGGSVWAAAITHGFPVVLWRDFFGGEKKLQLQRPFQTLSNDDL